MNDFNQTLMIACVETITESHKVFQWQFPSAPQPHNKNEINYHWSRLCSGSFPRYFFIRVRRG
ncbi:MAG: hypothetical protein M0R00_02690, partial [Candidatus Omnitrophica bacterium]|nr:hypothetical protein [Candidatus Omnitrophota bacterium]